MRPQTSQIESNRTDDRHWLIGNVICSDWLDEECGNLAREGLRTLVFGRRILSEDEYQRFARRYGIEQ